jgi:hypothetical protein
MICGYPTEEELRNRIRRQLQWHGSTDTVALIWHGYLAALLEWGVIDIQIYDRLISLLPSIGYKELDELFADEPISPEREKELDDFVFGKKNS